MLSQLHRLKITKSCPNHKTNRNLQDGQTLFDTLNTRMEQNAKIFHCYHSSSTRSPIDSDEDKESILLKTQEKTNFTQAYDFLIKESTKRLYSPVHLSPLSIQEEFIYQIKSQARQHALELNLKFQSMMENSNLELHKELELSEFVREFDKCFEMVETLQKTYTSIQAIIPQIQDQFREIEFEGQRFDETELVDLYTKELLDNSKTAKSLCKMIGILLNTSLFENETSEVMQSLLALSQLNSNKSKSIKNNHIKSSILEYKQIAKKIEDLQHVSHRIPVKISSNFIQSLKKKQPKSKKNK